MRTGLRKQIEQIIGFLNSHYPGYLDRYGIKPPFITTEFIDFDRFQNDFVLFAEIDTVNFNPSPYADDCGGIQRMLMDIFLVFRNDTVKNLDIKLMDASTAMYELLNDERLARARLSIADNLTVRGMDFFKYVEGSPNLVASKIGIELEIAY